MSDKLLETQNELIKSIDNELKQDEDIKDAVEQITASLMSGITLNKYFEINNKYLAFKYYVDKAKNQIVLNGIDKDIFSITMGKRGLYTARADMDNSYTERECLRSAVEALIRHITGRIIPEIIDDDNE